MTNGIELVQVEPSDMVSVQRLINSEFYKYLPLDGIVSLSDIDNWLSRLNSKESYFFGIKAEKDSSYKKFIIGICSVGGIDWLNRTADIMLVVDRAHSSLWSRPAFNALLQFCFKTLNLRKLSIELFPGSDQVALLESLGFVAEGVRNGARYKGGRFVDTTVCSILSQDYLGPQ